MFTGLVEEVGRVIGAEKRPNSMKLTIAARTVLEGVAIGDSISIDGACQTVTAFSESSFTVDTLGESMRKTTLGSFTAGRHVNLERSLTPGKRLGGHFVQGHVNGTGAITAIRKEQDNVYVTVRLPEDLVRSCIPEGSIALDGMSLTIADLQGPLVTINVIPHTFMHTSLQYKKAGDAMNVETDMLGRYVERLLGADRGRGLSAERLKNLGW